jgi:hypothetical protein
MMSIHADSRSFHQEDEMSLSECHGVVRGRSVILDKGAKLRNGTRVVVVPMNAERGSPAAILTALTEAPAVAPEDVDELERLIEAVKRPLIKGNPLLVKRQRKKG